MAGQRLKFLIAINLTIKKLISVNLTFNLKLVFQLLCEYESKLPKIDSHTTRHAVLHKF